MRIFRTTAAIAALLFMLSCKDNVPTNQDVATLNRDINSEAKKTGVAEVTDNADQGNFKDDDQKQQAPPDQQQDKKKKQPVTAPVTKIEWDKKIIKTGALNLEIKDYNSYYASVKEKIKNLGGYIAQEEQHQSEYKIENSMIIKVPVDQFDNAMAQLTANAEKINERTISSEDVTAQVIDTKSRMEAKKQVRQRYMELLGQAKNMNDILSVQSEINGIQEEIESASGRIEYLTHAAAFSTIRMTYYQVLDAAAKNGEEVKPSFGDKLNKAVVTGWEIVSNVFIALVTVWPLLLGSLFVYLLYKKLRTQKPKQA